MCIYTIIEVVHVPGPGKPPLITHQGLYSQPTEEVGTLLPHITGEVRVKRLGQAQ